MPDRVSRASMAIDPIDKVNAGRTMCDQRRLEEVELAAQQAVDGVEPGHVRGRALNETETSGAGEEAEIVEEYDQQDQPEPERGHGDAPQGQHSGDVVGHLVAMQRRDDSQGNTYAEREDQSPPR